MRAMSRLVMLSCAPILCLQLVPALALAQGVNIDHTGVGCVVAGKFPRFDARLDPSASVAWARLNFRPEGGAHWYYVDMKPEAGVFHGILPKPQKTLHRFSYYIDVTDKGFNESRTAEFAPDVASGPAACGREKVLAAGLSKANVLLHAPEGVVGAPTVPGGFATDGVVTAGGGGSAGTTAATGGGLGAKAVVLGTVLVAGGAAAVVAATSGGESGEPNPAPPTTTPPAAPPPTTQPPAPPPAATLTGRWVGTRPSDGLFFDNLECGGANGPVCMCGLDMVLDLVQSGNSLSGSADNTIRENPGVPCPNPGPSGACTCGAIGETLTAAVTGSVNGASVTMQWTSPTDTGGIAVFNFNGTLVGTRMAGTLTGTASLAATTGNWAANKQ